MRKIFKTVFSISCFSALMATASFASNPASEEWVLQQIAGNQRQLTAADWSAICTSGIPASSTGCYGNVSSGAFSKVSDRLGGFTSYANINPTNTPSSVFVKSFFGGTNIPASANSNPGFLEVQLINSAGRCGLFTQSGFGLGLPGVSTNIPVSGDTAGLAPNSASVVSINNAAASIVAFNNQNSTLNESHVTGPQHSNPLYLVCVGYNPGDGSTAAALSVNAT